MCSIILVIPCLNYSAVSITLFHPVALISQYTSSLYLSSSWGRHWQLHFCIGFCFPVEKPDLMIHEVQAPFHVASLFNPSQNSLQNKKTCLVCAAKRKPVRLFIAILDHVTITNTIAFKHSNLERVGIHAKVFLAVGSLVFKQSQPHSSK